MKYVNKQEYRKRAAAAKLKFNDARAASKERVEAHECRIRARFDAIDRGAAPIEDGYMGVRGELSALFAVIKLEYMRLLPDCQAYRRELRAIAFPHGIPRIILKLWFWAVILFFAFLGLGGVSCR